MAEIIARFADGRLLVQEDKTVESGAIASGYMFFRVGHVRTIEKVLSLDAAMSGHPDGKVAAELRDVAISGDTLRVQLRRMDLGQPTMTGSLTIGSGLLSGLCSGFQGPFSGMSGIVIMAGPIGSGTAALGILSGTTSGLGYYEPIHSGSMVSGILKIVANVIGY